MFVSFAATLAAAVAFGIASVAQQAGARRPPARRGIGPGLLADLLRQPWFSLGLGLDVAGFVLTFVALRRLPLFAVEATVASSLAVTALVAAHFLGGRLSATERLAVGAVVVGLGLVGASARPEGPPTISVAARLAVLGGVPALALLGVAASTRVGGRRAAPVLGALAGVGFAGFGVAGRVLPPTGLLGDPLSWAAAAYVVLGLLLYGAALQRGPVTGVAAATSAVETLVPALVGLALADGARAGLGPLAFAGFAVTLTATLILIRAQAAASAGGAGEAVASIVPVAA